MTAWLAAIAALAGLAVVIFKWVTDNSRAKRQRIDAAAELLEEGVVEHDASKITAALDQLHHS